VCNKLIEHLLEDSVSLSFIVHSTFLERENAFL